MNLRVSERPEWEPVSLEEMKEWLRVDIDDEDDLISSLISAAREFAETFTRRTIPETTWELTLDRFPCGAIELPVPPVQSVEISYLDPSGEDQDFEDFTLTTGEPGILRPITSWPTTKCVPEAVTISMLAGWHDVDDVPAGLKAAIKMIAAGWYENREHVATGSYSKIPFAAESLLIQHRWGSYS